MRQIVVKDLSKSFDKNKVLHNINLTINKGESIAIVGGSGCGKSVLMKCIAGLIPSDKGTSIKIKNIECGEQHISKRDFDVKHAMSILFQGNALFDSITVARNISFSKFIEKNFGGFISNKNQVKLDAIAKQYLSMVSLDENNMDKYPHELSGGMQKRVAIARAISTTPEILLLDEPTTGLDPVTSESISDLIKNIHKQIGATVITITHDPICVSKVAERIILIENGTIAFDAKISEIDTSKSEYIKAFKNFIKNN